MMNLPIQTSSTNNSPKRENAYSHIKNEMWRLGRKLKYQPLPEEEINMTFEHKLKSFGPLNENETETSAASFNLGLATAVYPENALADVRSAILEFKKSWGEIWTPHWCRRCKGKYELLYLALYIYNETQRDFPFAQNAVAKTFGFEGGTVRLFLLQAIAFGLIKVTTPGTAGVPSTHGNTKYGRPTYYRVIKEDEGRNLEQMPLPSPTNDNISFRKLLQRICPWLYAGDPSSIEMLGGGTYPVASDRSR